MKSTFNRYATNLLVKYILGEATLEEEKKVTRRMAADPRYKNFADDMQRIWKESRRLAPAEPIDASAAWQRFLQSGKISGTADTGTIQLRLEKPGKMYLWRAVAAAVLMMAAGLATWWALTSKDTGKEEEMSALSIKTRSIVRTDTLPDGSRVTLNKFSSLVLPAKWGRASRVARLKGEAFFQVVHEPARPFIVETGSVIIRDAGTSFDVRSINGTTEVIVEDGAIVVTHGAFTVKASAGEKVVINAGHEGITKTSSEDKLYQYYRTRKFICRRTPLPEFVAALNDAYGVKVVLQGNAVQGLLLTTTFDNDDLDNILSVVSRTFGLVQVRKEGRIVLKQI